MKLTYSVRATVKDIKQKRDHLDRAIQALKRVGFHSTTHTSTRAAEKQDRINEFSVPPQT